MFIKKNEGSFECVNIRINKKFVDNKKINIFVIQKKRKIEGVNYFLINNNF